MSLREAIERIREEVAEHTPISEAMTCECVIRPLLEAAGYSRYEIHSQAKGEAGGVPDYTILPGTQHTWYVEAKSWRHQLTTDGDLTQAMNYAHSNGRRWVVLTNGREWRLYDDHIQGVPAPQRLVALARLQACDELLRLLAALGPEQVRSGEVVRFAIQSRLAMVLGRQLVDPESHVIQLISRCLATEMELRVSPQDLVDHFRLRTLASSDATLGGGMGTTPKLVKRRQSRVAPKGVGSAVGERACTLKELYDRITTGARCEVSYSKPSRLALPDGTQFAVRHWAELATHVVRWLAEEGRLPPLPYRGGPRGSRWFLNREPTHPTKPMKQHKQVTVDSGTVYVDVNRSASAFVTALYRLCGDTRVSPDSVVIQLTGQEGGGRGSWQPMPPD